MYPSNFLSTSSLNLSGVEIGTHFYWQLGAFSFHGQVFIVSWVVIAILVAFSLLATSDIQRIP